MLAAPLLVVSFSCRFSSCPTFAVLLLCSRQSVLWQSRFRADTVLVSLLNGECVLYDAVAIVLFTSLKKHIDEASPAFLTMDILRLFVLVFFGSFAFGVIPGAWSPGCFHQQSISVCSKITRSALCVSPHISRFGVSAVAVLHGRQFPETVQRPIPCTDFPCFAGCSVSQVVCSSGYADDMPVVDNNRCLELDSVVLLSFCSCSSLVVYAISVVAGAGSYGPDCSDEQRGRRLGYAYRVGPTGVGCVFVVFSPVPGAGSFLSCSTSSSTLSGSGGSSRSTGTPDVSASCADAVTCLWFASRVHPVVFDYREHDLRCGGLLLGPRTARSP